MLKQKPCLRNVEIPGGRGVIKDPLGTEIPKGWGDANQKPSVGGVWIFSGTTHSSLGSYIPLRPPPPQNGPSSTADHLTLVWHPQS